MQHGDYIVTAFNVAVDVNIAFCVAFVFLNSIQWPELLPDTNVSSRAFLDCAQTQQATIYPAGCSLYERLVMWEKWNQGSIQKSMKRIVSHIF